MALVLRQLLAMVPEPQRLVNRKSIYDWAPLHLLANGGHHQEARAGMISQLCQAKADVEVTKRNGTTPLMAAAATSQRSPRRPHTRRHQGRGARVGG